MLLEQHHRPNAANTSLIEDLLELAAQGRQDAVDAAVTMLDDLVRNGLESRYAKPLKALPLWELKTWARGGVKGGVRVYFFVLDHRAHVINVDVKSTDTPDMHKLLEAVHFYRQEQGKDTL